MRPVIDCSHLHDGLALSKDTFQIVPNCANANVTAKVFGYAHSCRQTLFCLMKLSKRARGYVLKHWRGALLVETTTLLRLRDSPSLSGAGNPTHDFTFPDKVAFDNPLVGFWHSGTFAGLNYIMSDGQTSDLPYVYREPGYYQRVVI